MTVSKGLCALMYDRGIPQSDTEQELRASTESLQTRLSRNVCNLQCTPLKSQQRPTSNMKLDFRNTHTHTPRFGINTSHRSGATNIAARATTHTAPQSRSTGLWQHETTARPAVRSSPCFSLDATAHTPARLASDHFDFPQPLIVLLVTCPPSSSGPAATAYDRPGVSASCQGSRSKVGEVTSRQSLSPARYAARLHVLAEVDGIPVPAQTLTALSLPPTRSSSLSRRPHPSFGMPALTLTPRSNTHRPLPHLLSTPPSDQPGTLLRGRPPTRPVPIPQPLWSHASTVSSVTKNHSPTHHHI